MIENLEVIMNIIFHDSDINEIDISKIEKCNKDPLIINSNPK